MRRSESQEFKDALKEGKIGYYYEDKDLIGDGSVARVYAGILYYIADKAKKMACAVRNIVVQDTNEYSYKDDCKIHSLLTRDLSSREAGIVKSMFFYDPIRHPECRRILLSRCDTTLDVVIEKIGELLHTFPHGETRYLDCFFVELLASMCRALSNLQRHSVVHADIKPENIGIRLDPAAGDLYCVLLDLGSAKSYDPRENQIQDVQNRLHGSAPYMAPEVCDAFGNTNDTPVPCLPLPAAVDMYSLGMVLSAVLVASRKPMPSQIAMPQSGLFAFAYIASQGLKYQIARNEHHAENQRGLFKSQEDMLQSLLALSPNECVYKLVECMCALFPENRPTITTLDAVIRRLESILSEKITKMTAEDQEKMRLFYRELITPPKNQDEEWSFFSEHKLAEAAAAVDLKMS